MGIQTQERLTCDQAAQEVAERISEYKRLGTANCENFKQTANLINELNMPQCSDYKSDAKQFATDLADADGRWELNCISKCRICDNILIFDNVPKTENNICLCPEVSALSKARKPSQKIVAKKAAPIRKK